ncbi:MAG: ATP-binding protein, partial [Anaerolineales bacterium]
TCPHLKIIASSREALGIAGETAYRVPSLSLPDVHSPISNFQSLAQYEAVQLFLERARAVQPRFALTAQNASGVAQICQRLDGIPLALELAAARVKMLSVEQIAARLDDRFRLLTGGSRAALPRQQTLRALIDWSYDLLPESERALLRQLSVFAGGWTLEAAEAICTNPNILDLLSHLVDKSLVVVEEQAQAGEARYRLLETIRQYAREKLVEAGEAVPARDRHLDYFLRYAVEAGEKIFGPGALIGLDRLTAESDNMRAALEWSLESHPETAMQLIGALGEFWLARNYETEGQVWCRAALARVEALPPPHREVKRPGSAWRRGPECWAAWRLWQSNVATIVRAGPLLRKAQRWRGRSATRGGWCGVSAHWGWQQPFRAIRRWGWSRRRKAKPSADEWDTKWN